MTIALIVVILLLCGVIFQQYRVRRRIVKTSSRLMHGLTLQNNELSTTVEEQRAAYIALEDGQQELVDNYENDFLNLNAQIDGLKNGAKYDRDVREETEKKLQMTNDVIDKHAGHCETILKDLVDGMMEEIQPKSE